MAERDARTRLIEAATELLADRPASAVTVREIAGRAGLHHSLIHRHFGSKEELVRAVVANIGVRYRSVVEASEPSPADPAAAFLGVFDYLVNDPDGGVAAFAGGMLYDDGVRQESFPGVDAHVAQLEAVLGDRVPARDLRLVTVAAIAFMGGWSLLEDWAMRAAHVEPGDVDRVRKEVAAMLDELVRAQLA